MAYNQKWYARAKQEARERENDLVPLIDRDDHFKWVFKKGKFEGKTIEEIAQIAPQYLQWAYAHAESSMSTAAMKAIEKLL
jgi:hypothetical protein